LNPILKPITTRVLLSLVVSNINVWEHETNVENALFQVIVTKEVYMDQPPS
jgi:ABC-type histidine transport system ATPase subunit